MGAVVTETRWFSTREIGPRTWAIDDHGQDVIYLACGKERGLLIDTGWGIGDLPGLVASLTSLPVTVVNTHGHPDHAFGNGQFARVHIAGEDVAFVRDPPTEATRRWIWDLLLPKPRPIAFEDWALSAAETVVPIGDGHVFDLGGRRIDVISVPGHTAGSIALLDSEMGTLFAGDNILSGATWLHLDESTSLSAFRASLQRLRGIETFDAILPAHGKLAALPLSGRVLEDLCCGIDRILEGALAGREEKTFAGNGLRCDFGSCGIVYRADRVREDEVDGR
jgi:hydroxyacylglutathione hydrolase